MKEVVLAREKARAVVREAALAKEVVGAGSIQRAPLDLKLRPVGLGLKPNFSSFRHLAYIIIIYLGFNFKLCITSNFTLKHFSRDRDSADNKIWY
ncbi:MAG: hypothetical protein QXF04_03250 [Candidatus Aenigmatarchaeota archaeon]